MSKRATAAQLKRCPLVVDGCPVQPSGRIMEYGGEEWLTLYPDDNSDDRLWEFGLTTGRILRTQGGGS